MAEPIDEADDSRVEVQVTSLKKWDESRENVFGVLEGTLTTEEKIGKLLAFLPMAFQVVEEARDTIARLRTELEERK